MNIHLRKLTFSSVLSAFGILLLASSQIVPSGRYSMTVLAGFPVLAVSLTINRHYGLSTYAIIAILCNFMFPFRVTVICFTLLFGLYPLLQVCIETNVKIRSRFKLFLKVICSLVSFLLILLFAVFFETDLDLHLSWYLVLGIWIGYSVFFALYDKILILFGQYYLKKFQTFIQKFGN